VAKRDDPNRLHRSRELLSYAVSNGCSVRSCGDHDYVTAPNGQGCALPRHGELPRGTHRAILKRFAMMGIACLVVALIVVAAVI
jgi:hypothetical protein